MTMQVPEASTSAEFPTGGADVSERLSLPVRLEWAMTAAIVLAAAVLSFLRLPTVSRHTVWAEDGAVFIRQSTEDGPFASLLRPYDGYLHAIPRSIIDLVSLTVPFDDWALGITIVCCGIVGLIAGLVFSLSRSLVPWLPARIAIALLTALTPTLPNEVLGNAANIHWFFLWAAPWLLLGSARSMRGAFGLGVVALGMALTEIQLVFFLPLLLWRWRDRRVWPVAGGMIIGLVAQATTTLLFPRERSPQIIDPFSVVPGFVSQVAGGTVLGSGARTGWIISSTGLVVPLAVLMVGVLACAYIVWRGSRLTRLLALTMLVGPVALFAAAFLLNPSPLFDFAAWDADDWMRFTFLRYALVPAMMMATLVPVAAAVAADRGRRIVPWLVIVGCVAIAALSFIPDGTSRSDGPIWDTGAHRAEELCATGAALAQVPVAPLPWVAEVPCPAISG